LENNTVKKLQTDPGHGNEEEEIPTPESDAYGRLMSRMLVGLTMFFLLASLVQLFYLHARIADPPGTDFLKQLRTAIPEQAGATSTDPLAVYAALEGYALNQRYHQGNVLLMSRIWVSYLSFVTGMILCLVGASFILGRLREPTSTVGADSNVLRLSINSSSPGIILASLGTALIITAILTNHRIEIQDQSVYLVRYAGSTSIEDGSFMPLNVESRKDNTKKEIEERSDFDCVVDPNGPQCKEQNK